MKGRIMEMEKKRGISGSTIKIIAIFAMLIDHIGAGVVGRYISSTGMPMLDTAEGMQWLSEYGGWMALYAVMRMIGRLGFPIFCFLLIEGFEHTRDVKKYAARLLAFCIISEVPFDLLFRGKVLEFGYQNVFFTLFIGLLVLCAYRFVEQQKEWNVLWKGLCYLAALIAGMAVAELLHTDYAAIGVCCILVLYIFRKNKVGQIVAGCIAFLWELTAPLAFLPIAFYNGKRGLKMKYFFYIFYPAHLLILYLICAAAGISGFAAM